MAVPFPAATRPSQAKLGLGCRAKVFRSTAISRTSAPSGPIRSCPARSSAGNPARPRPRRRRRTARATRPRCRRAAVVVGGGDAVLGDQDRHPAGHLGRVAHGHAERVGPVGRADQRVVRVLGVRQHAVGADLLGRVGLHADEIVTAGSLQVEVLPGVADLDQLRLATGCGGERLVGHRPADRRPQPAPPLGPGRRPAPRTRPLIATTPPEQG
jgi:hypothetical protein